MYRESRHFGKITGQFSPTKFHLSLLGGSRVGMGALGCGMRRRAVRLVAKVGTSKSYIGTQGLHNKPVGCGASGAYDPGPDREEEQCDILHYLVP